MKALLFLLLTFYLQAHGAYRCERVFSPLTTEASRQFTVEISDSEFRQALLNSYNDLLNNGQLAASTQVLKEVSRTDFKQITTEQMQTLKATRKKSAALRSVLQIFSKKHELPEDFSNFVRDLGRLNDLLAVGKLDEAPAMAKQVLKEKKQLDFNNLLNKTKLASAKSTLKYMEDLRDEAVDIMGNKKITIEDYHEVRKALKEFLYFYQIKAQSSQAADQNPVLQQSLLYLFDLNEQLGELNDDLTADVLDGKAHKTKTKMRVPDELRELIIHFLENSRIVIDSAS